MTAIRHNLLMGAYFGRCLSTITDCFFRRPYVKHTNISVDEDEQAEQNCAVPITLELIEETNWSGQDSNYKGLDNKNTPIKSVLDNPLQVLDASGLIMNQGCVSLTPASSVDLEWENEGIPIPIIETNKLQSQDGSLSEPTVNNGQPASLTASPWSQVSTPNSLEWDAAEADDDDLETDKLLTEIERLKNRTLEETAEWVNSN